MIDDNSNPNEVMEIPILNEVQEMEETTVLSILLTPTSKHILVNLIKAHHQFEVNLAEFKDCLKVLSDAQLQTLTVPNLLQSNNLFDIYQSTRPDAAAGLIERLYARQMHASNNESPKNFQSFL